MATKNRHANVNAAQWSSVGGDGTVDLSKLAANVYGENVFSTAVQRQRLPKEVYRKLEASGSPWISSLPENSAIAVPSPEGLKKESCFSAVSPVSGWNQCV